MPTEYHISYTQRGERKRHPHAETKTDLFVIMRGLLKDGIKDIRIEVVPPITGLRKNENKNPKAFK